MLSKQTTSHCPKSEVLKLFAVTMTMIKNRHSKTCTHASVPKTSRKQERSILSRACHLHGSKVTCFGGPAAESMFLEKPSTVHRHIGNDLKLCLNADQANAEQLET